jgi:nucleoid-associated protein YgaU
MSDRARIALRHVAVSMMLAAAAGWLWQLGQGPLATPTLSVEGARAWLEQQDTLSLAFTVIKAAALAFASYLAALTAVGGILRWHAAPRAIRLVDRLTPSVLRGLLGGVAALGVMATPPSPDAPTATDSVGEPQATESSEAHATLRLLTETTAPAAPGVVESPENTWVVQPGESLWLIATEHLSDQTGAPVTERTIASYWRRLIEVNRDRLANPDDPNLIFVDQVLELPAVDG